MLSLTSLVLLLTTAALVPAQIQQRPCERTPQGCGPPSQPPSNPQRPENGNGNTAHALNPQCQQQTVRREFRELPEQERHQYIAATQCLKRTPSILPSQVFRNGPRSTNVWDDLVFVHYEARVDAHRTAAFLPWHRRFVSVYEDLLRTKCGYTGGVPYWDWTQDSQAPERSLLLTPQYFGGNGRQDSCIRDGAYSNWTTTFPPRRESCLQRRFQTADDGQTMNTFPAPSQAELYIQDETYDAFRRNVENWLHNVVHTVIGGDMSSLYSVNDPLFFLHHAQVDRLWALWQREHPDVAHTYSGNVSPDRVDAMDATPEDIMRMFGLPLPYSDAPVSAMFEISTYCYSYSPGVVGNAVDIGNGAPAPGAPGRRSLASGFKAWYAAQATAPAPVDQGSPDNDKTPDAYDRTDKYNIRCPRPMDEGALRNLGYDDAGISRIRLQEEYMQKFTDYVNRVAGYVSAAALSYVEKSTGWRPCSEEEARIRHLFYKMIVHGAKLLIGEFKDGLKGALQTAKDVLNGLGKGGQQPPHPQQAYRQSATYYNNGYRHAARPVAYY